MVPRRMDGPAPQLHYRVVRRQTEHVPGGSPEPPGHRADDPADAERDGHSTEVLDVRVRPNYAPSGFQTKARSSTKLVTGPSPAIESISACVSGSAFGR